jgi:hypothetical protein
MKWHNKKVVKHNMDLRFCVSYIFMIKVSHTHILSICKNFDQIDLVVLHISKRWIYCVAKSTVNHSLLKSWVKRLEDGKLYNMM